jgi:DNA repair protein RecN (Recombination protein N)
MLKSLRISNYALISELNIEFKPGFSVITGETGAGKSIIIGALSLILGQRADNKTIKTDAEKCVVEAEFDISTYPHLHHFFIENDLDNYQNQCIIRRELINSGKSRAFINDTPVGLNIIRDLTNQLIDIHSQHENLLLSNVSYQLDVVDSIAQNSNLLNVYKLTFWQWRELRDELKELQKTAEKQALDADYIQFQFQQLTDARLNENEQDELESELETLTHSEEIKSELQRVTQFLEEEQMSLPSLKESMLALSHVKAYIPEGENWFERLQSVFIELKDISAGIRSFEERVEFNPDRLSFVEGRLNELYLLLKKFKVTKEPELMELRKSFAHQLEQIDSFDEEIEALKSKIEEVFDQLKSVAAELSESRKKACLPIESFLVDQLTRLGMPNIQFQVSVSSLPDFTETGTDEVQFLFSANKNRAMQPVSQIASGGEVSRLMLSIKSLVAHKAGWPTIIFDEIDAGISGEIAHRMAEIMQSMSTDIQVIAITHLPQIAAKGKQHYRVYKNENDEQTNTYIQLLNQKERIGEIAQLLSGKNITEASIKNAEEMLSEN